MLGNAIQIPVKKAHLKSLQGSTPISPKHVKSSFFCISSARAFNVKTTQQICNSKMWKPLTKLSEKETNRSGVEGFAAHRKRVKSELFKSTDWPPRLNHFLPNLGSFYLVKCPSHPSSTFSDYKKYSSQNRAQVLQHIFLADESWRTRLLPVPQQNT